MDSKPDIHKPILRVEMSDKDNITEEKKIQIDSPEKISKNETKTLRSNSNIQDDSPNKL